jgi:bifunctional UDP-N-acetylglucosamine pyrophosphorylase/glucosamine-1-phosphate N-acetyltransferase
VGQGRKTLAVVLAAGEGKRLKSATPKVLHRVAGKPLLAHVLDALDPLDLDRTIVVASNRKDEIEAAIGNPGVEYVIQDPPLGTGDAVRVALAAIPEEEGTLLVLPGDTPLVMSESLQALVAAGENDPSDSCLLAAEVGSPHGYGRVILGADGLSVDRIVEERDATESERAVTLVNSGMYAFDLAELRKVIDKLDKENAQGEYYLTDVVPLVRRVVRHPLSEEELAGVNSRAQLAEAGALMRERVARHWMDEGVTIVDPSTTYIDASVEIEADATIFPFTFLEGITRVGAGAEVGPQVRAIDSEIAARAVVSFAVLRETFVGEDASVGPFASLRPGTRIEKGARAGTFVETKNTTIGEDSKANHLSYLGDAEIGRGVNVGAGTITCNWDGVEKHKTVIDDDAYIGSDTMIVAPAHIGKRAATGAGSVVKGDVPDDALAVGVPARIIEGQGNKMGRVADKDDPNQGE